MLHNQNDNSSSPSCWSSLDSAYLSHLKQLKAIIKKAKRFPASMVKHSANKGCLVMQNQHQKQQIISKLSILSKDKSFSVSSIGLRGWKSKECTHIGDNQNGKDRVEYICMCRSRCTVNYDVNEWNLFLTFFKYK